jgi:tetratricopeptide (TPR) repeat protein
MGLAESVSGKPQEAMKDYLKALEKDPKRASSLQLLFDTYMHENRFDDARKMLDDSLQKNPSNSAALSVRGMVSLQQGKTDVAMKDFEKALELDPNQDIAANNEAYLLAEQGRDLETALRYAQAVRRRRGEDPNAADTLGWVYYKLGRFTPAVDEMKFAVSKQPANPVFEYHLGAIYKANNQRSEAEAALKKAIAAKTDFKERPEAEALLQNIEYWRHLPGSAEPAKSK